METAARGRSVHLPGRGATFVREVEGPPGAPVLLLLHGLTATAQLNWSFCFEPLRRAFRVVALDQRGHGRGIRPIGGFKLEDCADDAAALADLFGVERLIPVGYSMGGAVAQLFWRRHPDRTAGLVLCATSFRFGGPRTERAAAALGPLLSLAARAAPDSLWQGASERLLERVVDPQRRRVLARELEHTEPSAVIEAGAALARFDSSPWLGGVDAPAAVVLTRRDQHVPAEAQSQLAGLIPDCSVHPVDGDHYACVVRPAPFASALFEACRFVALRGASVRPVSAAG